MGMGPAELVRFGSCTGLGRSGLSLIARQGRLAIFAASLIPLLRGGGLAPLVCLKIVSMHTKYESGWLRLTKLRAGLAQRNSMMPIIRLRNNLNGFL